MGVVTENKGNVRGWGFVVDRLNVRFISAIKINNVAKSRMLNFKIRNVSGARRKTKAHIDGWTGAFLRFSLITNLSSNNSLLAAAAS